MRLCLTVSIDGIVSGALPSVPDHLHLSGSTRAAADVHKFSSVRSINGSVRTRNTIIIVKIKH